MWLTTINMLFFIRFNGCAIFYCKQFQEQLLSREHADCCFYLVGMLTVLCHSCSLVILIRNQVSSHGT